MKILLHDYGGYAFSLQLSESLVKKNHTIDYIHGGSTQVVKRFRDNGLFPHSLTVDSIELAQPFAKYSFVQRWRQEREYANRLKQIILDTKPEIVVSANAPLDVQSHALQASKELGIPFVFWWQDVVSIAMRELLSQKYGVPGKLIGMYYQRMERNVLRQSNQIISISDDFLPIAHSWDIASENISVLPNWAPLADISVFPKDNPWARKHKLTHKFVFLYAGILGLKHTPEIFLKLAQNFLEYPDIVIVVVSEGPGADWLVERKQFHNLPNLQILPFQDYEDFALMLASADVLVAILNEQAGDYSVPSKVLSYLCANRPVLLSAPETNEAVRMVKKHEMGFAASPTETDKFFKLALELYKQPNLRSRLGENARFYAEKNFEINKIANKFSQTIRSCF